MQKTLLEEDFVIWHHIGFPKVSGVYRLESEEMLFAFFDSKYKVWLQCYDSRSLAEENAVEWLLMSSEDQVKNLNQYSNAWQKMVYSS